jgi:hypothetical protein
MPQNSQSMYISVSYERTGTKNPTPSSAMNSSLASILSFFKKKCSRLLVVVKKVIDVRKTGPRSNKIKQMQKQNTEDTQYKRDTDLRGSPSVGYVHQRNCQVLPLLLSSKMKG